MGPVLPLLLAFAHIAPDLRQAAGLAGTKQPGEPKNLQPDMPSNIPHNPKFRAFIR